MLYNIPLDESIMCLPDWRINVFIIDDMMLAVHELCSAKLGIVCCSVRLFVCVSVTVVQKLKKY